MYYPSLFAPVRPYDSQPNPLGGAANVPVVGATGRENPLDLSTKPIRQSIDPGVETEATGLLMLDHRKLANLAASHSLSAMGRQLAPGASATMIDPTLYRLAYGPEALAMQAPFCYDRATGVAVPTSLAGHQLMTSYLQQRERCIEQQQQQAALMAARTSAQQAAVAAAFMDPASIPYSLRTAMTQREAAAALAATRGMYASALPTPMVLPALSLYTEDKGAFTSLRNGNVTEKSFLNGATAGSAVEATRFVEHLQRLREQHMQQAGKCNNACCAGMSGLPTTVSCACCIQSPSQATLCARSPMGCLKTTSAAPTGQMCNTTCDYLQPGLTYLHRPTAATVASSELRLPVPSFGTAKIPGSTADTTSSAPAFQPASTVWSSGLSGVCGSGKTAFSVPKKKDANKPSTTQKDPKFVNGFYEKELKSSVDFTKRETDYANVVIKKEPNRGRDEKDMTFVSEGASTPNYQRREHDVKSMLTPRTTSCVIMPKAVSHYQTGIAQTTVTAATPIVPTKCEGGTIPKTRLPPVLEPFRPVDLVSHNGDHYQDTTAKVPSPQDPPPLIAVANGGEPQRAEVITKNHYPYSIAESSMLRHQALLHSTTFSTPVKATANHVSLSSDHHKHRESPKKVSNNAKVNGFPCYVKEEPSTTKSLVPPITIPKPVPHIPSAHHLQSSHFTSHYRPFAIQNHPSWMPPANPNVTVSATVPPPKSMPLPTSTSTTSVVTSTTSSAITSSHHKIVKSEPLPLINIKKEPECDHNSNVLQSLLIKPNGMKSHSVHVETHPQHKPIHTMPTPSVIMSNPNAYPVMDYHSSYQHMSQGLNLSHNKHVMVNSNSPSAGSTAPITKQEPKVECGVGLDFASIKHASPKKRSNDSPIKNVDCTDKKRIAKMEYAVAPGFAFQYPPYTKTEPKEIPACPYTFVPEPPGYYEKQVVVPKEIRPLKTAATSPVFPIIPQEFLPEDYRNKKEGYQSVVESPFLNRATEQLPIQLRLHLKNAQRYALARARSRLLRRALSRIYQANLKKRTSSVMCPELPREPAEHLSVITERRILYKIGKRRRIRSGLDMAIKRNKKKRGVVYKLQRQKPVLDECTGKIIDQPGSIPIPAEMKKVMVNKALGETVLHRASRLGYPEVVAYCLETNGGNVNARDNAGYTPLHETCSRGHLDIARALLQYGADVNASAAGGIRPLHDAVENDHVEVVRLLLSFGADPTIATYSGLTPLKLARSPLMAEFLQGFIADISGEMDYRPYLPWRFWGSATSLDPEDNGYDVFDGVPSDGETDVEGEGDDFLFEVSDSPHLPTFRLILPPTATTKSRQCNYLRLSDVLRKTAMPRTYFLEHYKHIEVIGVPRHEFEASATCSQLLTGSKLDTLFASRPYPDGLDIGHTVELVRLDNNIRKVLGIETISVR